MIPGVKNFAPYTLLNPLHSPRSLRKVARRIKTRALRAGVATVGAVAWLAIIAGCTAGDDVRRVTLPPLDAATGPLHDCRSAGDFCTDANCREQPWNWDGGPS